jgi:histidine ammonia-lyase
MTNAQVSVDGRTLSCADVAAVAAGASVRLDPIASERMAKSAQAWSALDSPDILESKVAWLVGEKPARATAQERRRAFVLGHCVGVGPALTIEFVRAMMLARANVLAVGLSGCRPQSAELLLAMLNVGVHPVVPSQGSVGAAGDLAPLAHMTQVAFRLGGKAWRQGSVRAGLAAMSGLPALEPTSKEALSFINGSSLAVAIGALVCHRARSLLRAAEVALAMSMEVVLADPRCLDDGALSGRGHPDACAVAGRLRALLDGSDMARVGRLPDAFSIRCAPAVLGAAWSALLHTELVITRELNGACDNPLIVDGRVVEAGNFHGAPIALALDHLKLALVQVGTIAERRTFRLTYGQLTGNLPSFLVEDTGVSSGFMLAQYTSASLASENKGLSHPASADSIPTGQHHEDHVSMAPISARTCHMVLRNLDVIVAIEALVAAQGLDWRHEGVTFDSEGQRVAGPPLASSPGVLAAFEAVRSVVPRWTRDRVLHLDLEAVTALVRQGRLVG